MTPAQLVSFGKYEIVRKLGRSMTDVYLARDPVADRPVVLKLIELCPDSYTQIIVEAERRGAAIQRQLHSLDPRILEVYESGEQNGCFFVAMQYAEGHSLASIVQEKGRLDATLAAQYAEEAASQLVTLHAFQVDVDGRRQAIVHGDIKPSNIQIGPRGELWLLDFGIAKSISATRNLTNHNLGSPAYCSPERLRRGQVDPHADLWALGVCLYEMITGLPPYHAQSTRKLENLIQSRRPPRALPDNCPDTLKAIIRKALAADIEHRYDSAAAFQADLRAFLDRRPTAAESRQSRAWDSNETVERSRPAQDPSASFAAIDSPALPIAHHRRYVHLLAEFNGVVYPLIAGIIVGLLLFMPASSLYRFWKESAPLRARRDYRHASAGDIDNDVRRYQTLQHDGGLPARLSLIRPIGDQLRASLMQAGDDVLDAYRNSSDPDLSSFDWNRARQCYARVVELDPKAVDARAKRALCDGYLQVGRGPANNSAAEASFAEAARLLPRMPDPHLGLARAYVYGSRNLGRAMAEFHTAERLGYHLGPRELTQQGEGFLARAEQDLKAAQSTANPTQRRHALLLAQRDFERARGLFEPLAGFSNVNARLEKLYADESRAEVLAKPPAVSHSKRPSRYTRRWR